MKHRTESQAHRSARDAAFRYKAPWRVFCDTSGAWNSERWRGDVPPTSAELQRAAAFGCPFGTLYGPGPDGQPLILLERR